MPRITEIVVLCEDQKHQGFARRLLEKLGERFRRAPRFRKAGSGSGKHYVEKQFPVEFRAYLKRKQLMRIALIVLIDCDVKSVEATGRKLRDSLLPEERRTFEQEDCLLVLLPKRSIETWIEFAQTGQALDEDHREKRAHPSAEPAGCKSLASQFYDWSRANAALPPGMPPSLIRAVEALRKFEIECGEA